MGILFAIGLILLILWALGFWVFSWGGFVHILLLAAIVLLIIWIIRRVIRR